MKINKNLLESIKCKSKKGYYSNKFIKSQKNAKSAWSVMGELINFPWKYVYLIRLLWVKMKFQSNKNCD